MVQATTHEPLYYITSNAINTNIAISIDRIISFFKRNVHQCAPLLHNHHRTAKHKVEIDCETNERRVDNANDRARDMDAGNTN